MSFEQWSTYIGIILGVLSLIASVTIALIRFLNRQSDLLATHGATLATINERTIEIQKDMVDQRDISRKCAKDVREKITGHTIKLENHEGRIKTLETVGNLKPCVNLAEPNK